MRAIIGRGRILFVGFIMVALCWGLLPAPHAAAAAEAAAGGRWCPQQAAPFCSENAFLDFWRAVNSETGGYALDIIGYPVSPTLRTAQGTTIQFYERAIFEWHPQNAVAYQVQLTRLGATAIDLDTTLGLKDEQNRPPEACPSNNTCVLASPTNHSLRGTFLRYWLGNGGLPVFGYPLTEQFQLNYNGKPITVQYFERNRFEAHPENTDPRYQVLLGRLGAETLANNIDEVKGWAVVATPNYGEVR